MCPLVFPRPNNNPMRKRIDSPGWILVAGLGLAAFGAILEPVSGSPQEEDGSFPASNSFASSDSNHRMIAVAGPDMTGGNVLYVIDTIEKRLSVYAATGGSKSMASVTWVGARNIGLDFAVDGWNDKSQHSFKDLQDRLDPGDPDMSDQ